MSHQRAWSETGRVVIAVCLAAYLVGAWAADCTRVVFSAHPDEAPYHWRQGQQIVGPSAELAARVFDEMGIASEARFVGPWERVLKAAETGEIDFVVSLKDTPERRAALEFVEAPSFANPIAVFVVAGRDFRFDSWKALIGKRGTRIAGERNGEEFESFADRRLQFEDSDGLDDGSQKLLAGRVDYLVTGLYTGTARLAALGLRARIHALPRPVIIGNVYFAFSRLSPCRLLIPAVNRRLRELTRSGGSAAILERGLTATLAAAGWETLR